jgi:small subunit ribosomal protein S1
MEFKNNEMEKLYAETFQSIEEGNILTGKVVAVKQDGVIVDVGYKSEGFIRADEFADEEMQSLKPGDPIEVYIVNIRDSEGIVNLSKERASKIKTWDMLEKAVRSGEKVV